jgi:hypothetical protein
VPKPPGHRGGAPAKSSVDREVKKEREELSYPPAREIKTYAQGGSGY